MYLMKIHMANKFREYHPQQWLLPLFEFESGYVHPKLLDLIREKLSVYVANERVRYVNQVLQFLTESEVFSHCYGTTSSSLSAMKSNFPTARDQQEIFGISPICGETMSLKVAEECVIVENPVALEAYEHVTGEPVSVTVYDISVRDLDPQPELQEPLFSAEEHFVAREDIDYIFTSDACKRNDVYSLSQKFLETPDVKFETVIYACPRSGKTTFNREFRSCLDTDWMYYWPLMSGSATIITNMPHLLRVARKSIAIIPSLATFRERCQHISGYEDGWYNDMLRETKGCTIRIITDRYLRQIPLMARLGYEAWPPP